MIWEKILCGETIFKRKKGEKSEYDNRNDFDIDFDEGSSSSQFRRLQDKAQVFPLEKGDFARTRLTHSIEVMSIAESLGKNAINILKKHNIAISAVNSIPTILKTAALLHDMGNPPFGHLGEDVISSWFENNLSNLYFKKNRLVLGKVPSSESLLTILNKQQRNDLKSFEGNAQLLRLIGKLNQTRGINVTYATLSVCVKYTAKSTNKGKNLTDKKIGYFYSENDFFNLIQEILELEIKEIH